jgi:predicted nucleic acid-binding protein
MGSRASGYGRLSRRDTLRRAHEGEAEAIALASECGAELLLIDEHRGRKIASRFGIRVAGVLGVLIEAKRCGELPAIKPVLDLLVSTAGFRISNALYGRVLEAADE